MKGPPESGPFFTAGFILLRQLQVTLRPTEIMTVGAIKVLAFNVFVMHFVESILLRFRHEPVYLALLMTLGTNFVHRTLEFIAQLTL